MKATVCCWPYLLQKHTAVCFSASCQLGSSGLSFCNTAPPVQSVQSPGTFLSHLQGVALPWNPEVPARPFLQPVKVPQESIVCSSIWTAPHNFVSCTDSQIMPSLPLSGPLEMLNLLAAVSTPASWILHLWTQPLESGGPANSPFALISICSGQSYHFPYKDIKKSLSQAKAKADYIRCCPHIHMVIYPARSGRLLQIRMAVLLSKSLSLKIQY